MFIIQHRRRREEKTDYRRRLSLLSSGNMRVAIRRSLSGVMVQFIDYDPKGDITKLTTVAADLKKFGWKLHTGNLPASYLIGLIAGLKAKSMGIEHAVLDSGLQGSTKGSRIYSALKGIVDAGVDIPHSDDILPDAARISGDHIAKYGAKLTPEKKKKLFSQYIHAGIEPEHVSKHFADVKKKIIDAKGVSK
jgi:large subunit ribosomal protein L18